MRHKVENNLSFSNKDKDHAKATLRNLITSFFVHKHLVTTLKKAKALSVCVDKLINVVNTKDQMNAIRFVGKYVFTKKSSLELFSNIAPKYKDKKSWFTRITAIKYRLWDNAKLVKIELI